MTRKAQHNLTTTRGKSPLKTDKMKALKRFFAISEEATSDGQAERYATVVPGSLLTPVVRADPLSVSKADVSMLFSEIITKVPLRETDSAENSDSESFLDKRSSSDKSWSPDDTHTSNEKHDFGHQNASERIHSLTREFRQALDETLKQEKGISVWDYYSDLSKSEEAFNTITEGKRLDEDKSLGHQNTSDRFRLRSNSDASGLINFRRRRFVRKKSIDEIKYIQRQQLANENNNKLPSSALDDNQHDRLVSFGERSLQNTPRRGSPPRRSSLNETYPPGARAQKRGSVSSVSSTSSLNSSPTRSPEPQRRSSISRRKVPPKNVLKNTNMKESNLSKENLHTDAKETSTKPIHIQDGHHKNELHPISPRAGLHNGHHSSTSPRNINYHHPNRLLHRKDGAPVHTNHDSSHHGNDSHASTDTPPPAGVQGHILRRLSHLKDEQRMRERSSSDVTHLLKKRQALKKLSNSAVKDDHAISNVTARRISVDNLPLSRNGGHSPRRGPVKSNDQHEKCEHSHLHHPHGQTLPHLVHTPKNHKSCRLCHDLLVDPNNLPKNIHITDFPAFKFINHSSLPEPMPILKGSPKLSPIAGRRGTCGHVQFAEGCKSPDLYSPSGSTLSSSPPKNHGIFHFVYDEKTKSTTPATETTLFGAAAKLRETSTDSFVDSNSETLDSGEVAITLHSVD